MNETDICSYTEDGQHRYSGRPWRIPVVDWVLLATFHDDPTKPVPLRYWEIDQCRRCGYQKSEAHGFTPRPRPARRRDERASDE